MASPAFALGRGSFTQHDVNALLAGDWQVHSLASQTKIQGSIPGRRLLTFAGALAITLSAPVKGSDDGKRISVLSTTAFAHTITCTGHLIDGNGHSNVMTFAAQPGAGIVLVAYQGNWYVENANFATGS